MGGLAIKSLSDLKTIKEGCKPSEMRCIKRSRDAGQQGSVTLNPPFAILHIVVSLIISAKTCF